MSRSRVASTDPSRDRAREALEWPDSQTLAGSAPLARLAPLREVSRHAGNRAIGRYLLQRTPTADTRELDFQDTFDVPNRTIRKVEKLTTSPGDPKIGKQPSIEEVYWVEFKVNADGVMTASARTVSGDGKFRSTRLRLGPEFGSAIKAFKGKGIDVKAFDGDWSYMNHTERSSNLEAFEEHLKENPQATRVDAARQTPSGKIAVREGFTEIDVGPTTKEADPDIGPGIYTRVRARFARPGVGSLPGAPSSSGSSDKDATAPPPARTSGAGPKSTTTTGTRVKAGIGLAILGANILLNSIIEWRNHERMKKALERLEPDLRKEQERFPTMGFLLVFRFSGAQQTPDGPGATGRFEGVSYRRAYTQAEAEINWRAEARMDSPGTTYMSDWVKPSVAPSPLELSTPFEKVALAKFAKLPRIEFQKVEFAAIGGFDEHGTESLDTSKFLDLAEAYRFLVLRMPDEIRHYTINRGVTTKEIDIKERSVTGGKVPVLMLKSDDPAVTVWPADTDTAGLFKAARKVDDKEGKLDVNANIDIVRWLPPDQVEIVQQFKGARPAEVKD